MLSAALSTDVTQVNEVKAAPAPRTKLPAPRYVVRRRDDRSVEHRTLLGAMKAALTLVDAGHHDVSVVDRRAAVVWRADRLGLTPMLDLDREAAQRSAAHYALLADSSWRNKTALPSACAEHRIR